MPFYSSSTQLISSVTPKLNFIIYSMLQALEFSKQRKYALDWYGD